ncbi:MAG: hypothetical protein ACREIT_06690 [Tepidisphaeraceae bacterium]
MLIYLVTRHHQYTIEPFLDSWGRMLRSRARVMFYDDLAHARQLPIEASYIFSDLERLGPAPMELAEAVAKRLVAGGARVLNHPSRVLRRYDLLRTLHQRGLNGFGAYRLNGAVVRPQRFPVFLRREGEHDGNVSPLLNSQEELDRAVAEARNGPAHDLLVVEYCDTVDAQGVFRKYSIHRIGDAFIPRHAHASHKWCLKYADIVDDSEIRHEREYVEKNPHADHIRAVFDLAGIDYGRVDYSIDRDGRPQVWEINTNPAFFADLCKVAAPRMTVQSVVLSQIATAFESLLPPRPAPGACPRMIPLNLPTPLLRRNGHRALDTVLSTLGHTLRKAACLPGIRTAVHHVTRAFEMSRW